MAVVHYRNASLVLNSVDLSDHLTGLSIDLTADELEDTAMGDTARSRIFGLKDSSFSAEFNQDFASGSVDATLWAAYDGGVAVPIVFKTDSGAVSATNPSYTTSVLVSSHSPASGNVGDLLKVSVTFTSVAAVTRATS